ncbi:MAG: Tm-1-like ATP-binding domain-containing protein [Clostridiales bacterium]|nr:Tm-1-like ATP-binding domain-containing protein [Clostridiales bacterium]
MKTIAIIESCDTKYKEAAYMKECIQRAGLNALVLNTATGPVESYDPEDREHVIDVSRGEIVAANGTPWATLEDKTKGEKIEAMRTAIQAYVEMLYKTGKIHGIISVGGLQNTVMATAAMSVLPIGFPKVMATTVASGTKQFSLVVGDKDIVAMPTICDCTGLNLITSRVIANACGCVIGMVQTAGEPLAKGDKPVIGLTLMGVTNNGCMAAVEELERNGYEVLGFHATGVGGSVMEQMAAEGLIDGVLDLTQHEITSEYFGGGFSYGPGAATRLLKTTANHVPLVVSLGGIDFVDYAKKEAHVVPNLESRKTYDHNADTVHIKITADEARDIAKIVAQRLNTADYPVKLLVPTDGMRHNTTKGEALYDPEADRALIDTLKANLNPNIEVIELEGNLDTPEWGVKAAKIMLDVMKSAGI